MADGASGGNGDSGSRLWEVVGGAESGGILVREGRELKSPEAGSRLSTGAIVQELKVIGERLHYSLVRGSGPKEGWVSVRLKDKALLVPSTAQPDSEKPAAGSIDPGAGKESSKELAGKTDVGSAGSEVAGFVPRPAFVAEPRKLRMLCLHGTAGSPGVLSRQLLLLSRELANDVELVFHGGHLKCEPDDPVIGGQVKLVQPYFPKEVLTQYAIPKGAAGPGGGGDPKADPKTWRTYDGIEEALALMQETLRREAPIDAVFGFSQGSNMLTLLAAQAVTGQGENFLCAVHSATSLPGWKLQYPELFKAPLPMPAMLIQGEQDVDSTEIVSQLYEASLVERRSHRSDHRPLPRDPQEAKELAQNIRSFLLRHCRGSSATVSPAAL